MQSKNYQSKTIIVGDVHGCFKELELLLEKANFKAGLDRLIFVGDVINRGPNSKECIKFIVEHKADCVLGNHEHFLIQSVIQKEYHWNVYKRMKQGFGSDFDFLIETIKKWPYWIEEEDLLVVHAGINVNNNIQNTDVEFLTSVREVKDKNGQTVPWYYHYHHKRLIVFGHWAKLQGVITKNVIGLDMGCVYGKKLRALILPDRQIVQVDALQQYFPC